MDMLTYIAHWAGVRLTYGFHWHKPLYPVRVLRNLLKARWYHLTGRKKFVLRGIDFALTYRCNFSCEHCYAERLRDKDRPLMTVADYRRVCEEAMALGCLCFSLQGGEVFLRRDWEAIVRAFKPEYNHLLITTNGSLITEARVRKLKALGLDTLYFSVDSGIAAEHDRFRNAPSSFRRIMNGVAYCKKHGVKVVFNTCVTRQNLYSEGLRRLLDFSHKHRILVETIFARCLGNYDGRHDMMLNAEDVAYYYRLRRKYPFVVRDLDNNYGAWGCPTVKEVLYITPYGDVCPCPYSHVTMGNVRNTPLAAIRQRGLATPWYDHYHGECLTAMDGPFMARYYPLVEKKPLISLNELYSGRIKK